MNEHMTDTLRANITKLRPLFFEKSDPNRPGENPGCRPIWDAITAELETWPDDKLEEFVDSLDKETDDMLFSAIWELAPTRPFLQPKYL